MARTAQATISSPCHARDTRVLVDDFRSPVSCYLRHQGGDIQPACFAARSTKPRPSARHQDCPLQIGPAAIPQPDHNRPRAKDTEFSHTRAQTSHVGRTRTTHWPSSRRDAARTTVAIMNGWAHSLEVTGCSSVRHSSRSSQTVCLRSAQPLTTAPILTTVLIRSRRVCHVGDGDRCEAPCPTGFRGHLRLRGVAHKSQLILYADADLYIEAVVPTCPLLVARHLNLDPVRVSHVFRVDGSHRVRYVPGLVPSH